MESPWIPMEISLHYFDIPGHRFPPMALVIGSGKLVAFLWQFGTGFTSGFREEILTSEGEPKDSMVPP